MASWESQVPDSAKHPQLSANRPIAAGILTSTISGQTADEKSDSPLRAAAPTADKPRSVTVADFTRGCQDIGAELRATTERLTAGKVFELCRTVRDGIELLSRQYPQIADGDDVVLALEALGYELEDYRGYPSISFDVMNPLQEIVNLGALLAQNEPRLCESIVNAAKWDLGAKVIYWPLQKTAREVA